MARRKLFRPDETYTKLGSQLCDEVSEYAAQLLRKYKDCRTRDVVTIVNSAFDYQACFHRLERQLEAAKEKERKESLGA